MLKALNELDPSLQLFGIDPVTEMLAVASRNLPKDVYLKQAWAEDMPFASKSFDVVISCNMFHYVRKPEAALNEVKRVLVPNGELILTDWCDDYLSCKLCELYLRLFNSAHYKAYSVSELRILLSAAKFELVTIERYKINWLWGLMTAEGRIRTQSY